MEPTELLIVLAIGAVAGWLAGMLMKGSGLGRLAAMGIVNVSAFNSRTGERRNLDVTVEAAYEMSRTLVREETVSGRAFVAPVTWSL